MNSNFKRKSLKKILCLFLILINVHIIFDTWINTTYIKSSKIDNLLIIRNSNSNPTRFENITCDQEVIWGNNITFSLNFTYTADNGTTWNPVIDPNAYCNITIEDVGSITDLVVSNMIPLGNGIFFKEINSSRLSAGGYGKTYLAIIDGYCPGYPNPNPYAIYITIKAIPTGISIHNYTTFQELTTNKLSQYYNEIFNVTFRYYNINTNKSLTADSFTYSWDYGSGDVNIDPRNSEYYTLEINTSISSYIGTFIFQINAVLENYTTFDYLFFLDVLPRPTTLNGEMFVYISSKIWVQEAHNFTFYYRDVISNETIGDLTYANYEWQMQSLNGTVVSEGSGNLTQNINNSYTLNFNTQTKPIGDYTIIVTLQKVNYEAKVAVILLEIIPLPMSVNGSLLDMVISKEVEYQQACNFTFELNNALTHSRIGDLDQAFYYWYRIDSNGTILEGPSENFDLIKDVNDLYILDFNTELMSIGFYIICVEFHKENYSSRYAVINLEINSPLQIYINLPSPNDIFNIKAPDFELEIIGSYDSIWYTLDNGVTNITVSALSGTINQIEWNKRENGIVSIKFYANNSFRFVTYAIVQVTKYVPENPYRKVFGYNLAILLGVIIIITLAIKKKILDKGLKRER